MLGNYCKAISAARHCVLSTARGPSPTCFTGIANHLRELATEENRAKARTTATVTGHS
jgi:hypothetical protein